MSDQTLIEKLANLSKTEADVEIAKLKLGFADEAMLKAKVNSRRDQLTNPINPTNIDDLGGLIGAGGLVTGVAAARIAELIKGQTINYDAVLYPTEILERLRTVLNGKDFGVIAAPNSVMVRRQTDGSNFCVIRLAVKDQQTAVTISGLDTSLVKAKAGDTVDSLLNLGKTAARKGNVIDNLFDVAGQAIDAATQAGSDLATAEKIASTIERYAADEERRIAAARQRQRQEAAEKTEAEERKTICGACGVAHGGGPTCQNCGAPTGLS